LHIESVEADTIRSCALEQDNSRIGTQPKMFFIDGPGGTGKTYCINALLNVVRRNNNTAIAVTSSGTAALLLKGGRTAHSTFKIPLDISLSTMCDITPRSEMGQLIKRAKLIIWDKCSMISKNLIKIVDKSFQDILKNNLPFGGCLFVFAGYFRQVLPIIPGASRSSIVSQCINRC
jgi:hypothetical protein